MHLRVIKRQFNKNKVSNLFFKSRISIACKLLITFILNFAVSFPTFALSPWYTGPLLAPSGGTVPPKHFNLETYAFYTKNYGAYDENWKSVNTVNSYNAQLNPILTYGLMDFLEVQFNIPYAINKIEDQKNRHIGDIATSLGIQLFRQKNSFADIKLLIQEIYPTGRFEDLNPTNLGTDGTGVGSYQTSVGLVFQKVIMFGIHPYRQRASVNYLTALPVHVRGSSIYGGNDTTHGLIKPGNLVGIDIAGELGITQNWVAVMEGYYFYRGHLSFSGYAGFDSQGNEFDLAQGASAAFTLAPAIEYNFSENYGLIAGVWFPVRAKNFGHFTSGIVAFNAYW